MDILQRKGRHLLGRDTEDDRVTPHLVCADAAGAIDFYKRAFGATELMRLKGPDGKLMHGCVSINGSTVMLADEYCEIGNVAPTSLKGTPVTIHLVVGDAEAVFERAVGAGARAVMPLTDMFWGDRYGLIEDPYGHRWSIAQRLRDMSAEDIQKAVAAMQPAAQAA